MLLGKSTAAAALLVSLALPATASAQYGDTGDSERPTIHLLGHFGATQIFRDLNVVNTAGQSGKMVFGAGVGMQVTPGFAVRALVDVSQAEGTGETSVYYGQSINRVFYGVDVQARHVTERGLAPYFTVGFGAVSVSVEDYESFTKGTLRGGLGLEYMPKTSALSYFAQGNAFLYDFDANVYKRDQVDMLWTVGLKYRLTK